MAVTAEAPTGRPGAGVALKTEITVIPVPETFTLKKSHIPRMDARIGAPDAVDITMTTAPGAGRITRVVAGSAVLDIIARRQAVFRQPVQGRVFQRDAVLSLMAGIAEKFSVMTAGAVLFLAAGIEPVRIFIIKVVNVPLEIIFAVTFGTKSFTAVASAAKFGIARGSIAMLMPPVLRVNIQQRDSLPVTQGATVVGFDAVVTRHAQRHGRHVGGARLPAFGNAVMAMSTFYLLLEMLLMVEFNRSVRIGQGLRVINTAMAGAASIDLFDVMTIPAYFHRRIQFILWGHTRFGSGMAGETFQVGVIGMGKLDIAGRNGQLRRWITPCQPGKRQDRYNHNYDDFPMFHLLSILSMRSKRKSFDKPEIETGVIVSNGIAKVLPLRPDGCAFTEIFLNSQSRHI